MLPKIELIDLVGLHKGINNTQKLLVNIRGCNGSGKSAIPMAMLNEDEYSFEVTWNFGGKQRVIATVFPLYQFIALGHYRKKCGGMDSMKTTDEIRLAVEALWNLNYNILMEGIMASTVRQTYIDLFTRLQSQETIKRDIVIYNIIPPIQTCLDRIQKRNGGKPVKEDQVASKWKTVDNNVSHFKEAGFRSLRVSNDQVLEENTLDWFFNNLKDTIGGETETHEIISRSADETPHDHVPYENKNSLVGYEWYEWYKEPDDRVKFNQKYRDLFWRFIYERLNIYHRRIVLGKPEPWTNDKTLQSYRFTNICRDMDKLTIYERRHILSKLDEGTTNIEICKKSVMFNVMLFRTFVKIETYEAFGFIDFSDTDWRDQWEKGKKTLMSRRECGIQNFTGSYMISHLHSCNPDKTTRSNKTLNAIRLLEHILNNIDDVYNSTMIEPYNMKEQLEYLATLNGVGGFTAYEYACSFAMSGRYFKNALVPWTQDNYTNIGPGSKRGIGWIFDDTGNLSEIECVIYLRSIWKSEMKRLGYYDNFIKELPYELDGDLDLRTIEQCLCETTKLNKLNTNTGTTKRTFTPETKDLSLLTL